MITYRNYSPVAYPTEKLVPVPGWGMRPLLAGNPVIAIGNSELENYQPVIPKRHPVRYELAPIRGIPIVPHTTRAIISTPAFYRTPGGMDGVGALGYDLAIKTPVGTQTISVPLEEMVKKAIDTGWPILQTRLEQEFPKLLGQAQDAVVTQLWPKMQPKLRSEINYGLGEARKTGYLIGAMIVASVFAAAWWVKKGK